MRGEQPTIGIDDTAEHLREEQLTASLSKAESSGATCAVKTAWAADDNDADERLCFVCCEGETRGALMQPCECSDRYLHIECQLRIMQQTPSHHVGCPVCKAPYKNVARQEKKHLKVTDEGKFMTAFAVGNLVLSATGVCMLYLSRIETSLLLLGFGLAFITLACGLSLFACRVLFPGVPCFVIMSTGVLRLSTEPRINVTHTEVTQIAFERRGV